MCSARRPVHKWEITRIVGRSREQINDCLFVEVAVRVVELGDRIVESSTVGTRLEVLDVR